MEKDEKELSRKDLEEVTGGFSGTPGLKNPPDDDNIGDLGPASGIPGSVSSGEKPER